MTQLLCVKLCGILFIHEFWEWIGGMLKCITRERQQGLRFAADLHPTPHGMPETAAPGLRRKCHLDGVQQRELGEMRKQTVFCIAPVNDPRKLSNRARSSLPASREFARNVQEPRLNKRLPLNTLHYRS